MTFIQRIYQRLSELLPNMTTRTFSHYCGMSEGYYGSVIAQNMDISSRALIRLAEVMEQLIDIKQRFDPATAQALREVQILIITEIATRAQKFAVGNHMVAEMINKAMASLAVKHDRESHMPAVIFG